MRHMGTRGHMKSPLLRKTGWEIHPPKRGETNQKERQSYPKALVALCRSSPYAVPAGTVGRSEGFVRWLAMLHSVCSSYLGWGSSRSRSQLARLEIEAGSDSARSMPRRRKPKEDSSLESPQPWERHRVNEVQEKRKERESKAAQVRTPLDVALSSEPQTPLPLQAHRNDGGLEGSQRIPDTPAAAYVSQDRNMPTASVQSPAGANVNRGQTQSADDMSQRSWAQPSRGRGRGPGAGAGPGMGVGRGGGADRIDALGRQMTAILRHRAVDFNLVMRSDGYVEVAELLKLTVRTSAGVPLNLHTLEDVFEAVDRDKKQRFGLRNENAKFLIRANQGHSIEVVKTEDLLKPILSAQDVPVCVHGTYHKYLDAINKEGLKRMGRLHVHFASGLPRENGVISGMRATSEVLIHLDVEKALKDGMKLFISENGVILTEGFDGVVPTEYFRKVEVLSLKGKH